MIRLLRFRFLVPLIMTVGMAQYAMVAYSVITSGEATLWTINSDALLSAGPLRYIKDFFVVFISITWVIVLPRLRLARQLKRMVKGYFLWFALVIFTGIIGFLLGYSPLFFLPAGLRWLLLLHAAFGIFILTSTFVTDKASHKFIFRILVVILLIDAYAVLLQFRFISNLFNFALGASRLTGFFSNAGVAAFFAMAAALFIFQMDGIKIKSRIIITFLCFFLALSTGTRFATVAVSLILLTQFWEIVETGRNKQLKTTIKLFFVPLAMLAIFSGYQALIEQVGRGDALSQQFEKGGRAANFLDTIEMFGSADVGELFFGRGIGIGTNTAIGSLIAEHIDPEQYRFNRLVDNALLTVMFQFGLFGSVIFWFGICNFILFTKPKYSDRAKQRYFVIIAIILLTFIAGSPFEHYFLMMAYATSLGAVYWSDRLMLQQLKAGKT